jgi:putative phosphoesterase
MSQELIGVISDTHGQFDPKIYSVFKGVSHILHAGDIGDLRVLRQLEQIAPVTAVWGNIDEGNVPPGVDEMQTLQLGGLRIFMIHILGSPQRLTRVLKQRIDQAQPNVVVFGHSHKPLLETHGKVLYFNPGSAGPKRFSLPRSVGLLKCQIGEPQGEIICL